MNIKNTIVAGAIALSGTANAQMALDQTVHNTGEDIYKTIVFANGNINNNPSYNYTGPKNIDWATSSSYGSDPSFWRNTSGNGTFVNTGIVGGSTGTTVPNETIGGNIISWNQATALQKNIKSNTNSLGINYTGTMKRARADTNNDGGLDAQLTTYTLPAGANAQAAGFQIGDVAWFVTPEIVWEGHGTTLLNGQNSLKILTNNWEWIDTDNVPGLGQADIPDWISEGLATNEVNRIKTTIYPNPTTDKVFIKLDQGQKIEQYQLVNTAGQQLLTGKDPANGIDVSKLPAGLYILQISVDGKIITHKVIKK